MSNHKPKHATPSVPAVPKREQPPASLPKEVAAPGLASGEQAEPVAQGRAVVRVYKDRQEPLADSNKADFEGRMQGIKFGYVMGYAKLAEAGVPSYENHVALHLMGTKAGAFLPDLHQEAYLHPRRLPLYNYPTTVFQACSARDGARILIQNNPSWTADDHRRLAQECAKARDYHDAAWNETLDEASMEAFGRPYQVTDYRISGIARNDYSEPHKEILRFHAHSGTKFRVLEAVHESAAKVRSRYADHGRPMVGEEVPPLPPPSASNAADRVLDALLTADFPEDERGRALASYVQIREVLQEASRDRLLPEPTQGKVDRILGVSPPNKGIYTQYANTMGNIVSEYSTRFQGPVVDALVAMDHQLSTDSDLETITAPEMYVHLRQKGREAMAASLGYSGYEDAGTLPSVAVPSLPESIREDIAKHQRVTDDLVERNSRFGAYKVGQLRSAFDEVHPTNTVKGFSAEPHWKDPHRVEVAGNAKANLVAASFEFFHGHLAKVEKGTEHGIYVVSSPGYNYGNH